MFNQKAVKYTFYLKPEDLSNHLVEYLDEDELEFLFNIHTSNYPHMESTEVNLTINYIYTNEEHINQINYILSKNNVEYKVEDVTDLVFTESPLIPLTFRILMMIYMRKYFTIDDMLDKIFKYGLTDTDKTIMEQLTQ
jgi:hypothetical protein